jgi:hypothetical protein
MAVISSQIGRIRRRPIAETIEFVASLPADERIRVVEETYGSSLILAEGYSHELLKSSPVI